MNKPRYIDRTETITEEKVIVVYVDTPDRVIYTTEVEDNVETAILDVEYLAKCVQAEAGNQDRLGKAYVVDCILNRFEAGNYSNIRDVINAPSQFSCVVDGDIKATPTQDIYEIIDEELKDRKDAEIKYFRTKHYHTFGTPCFQYGAHFFSK